MRQTVIEFTRKNISPIAQKIDQENEFPKHLWKKLGDLGLLGITISEEYGGSAMSYLVHLIAVEEISRASASVGLLYGAHSSLCVNQLHTHERDAKLYDIGAETNEIRRMLIARELSDKTAVSQN